VGPIIFVHGAGLDRTSWKQQVAFFPDAVAVDLPGHGASPAPPLDSVPAYATWLGETMRRFGGGPVTLVGHSMGSLIALEAAARHPDFVSGLVLISTAARMPVHRDLLTAAQNRDPQAAALVMKWSLPEDGRYGRPKEWVQPVADKFVAAAESGVLAADFAACDTYDSAVELAAEVRCPSLLLLGQYDVMTKPQAAQPLATALQDARIVVIAGAGHMLPLERPAELNEAINLFLTTT
jgi:pimeloyl-ACP methyl ester carboxylesterase